MKTILLLVLFLGAMVPPLVAEDGWPADVTLPDQGAPEGFNEKKYEVRRIEYDHAKTEAIRSVVKKNGWLLQESVPLDKVFREGFIYQRKRWWKDYDKALQKTGLFRRVSAFLEYEPGIFYVFASPGSLSRARRYLEERSLRPQLWNLDAVHVGEGAPTMFQCQCPPGEESFWITQIKQQAIFGDAVLDTGVYWTRELRLQGDLTARQRARVIALAREHGLLFREGGIDVLVPPGMEEHYLRLFAANGVTAVHWGMLDADATTDAVLKNQTSMASTGPTPMSLGEPAMKALRGYVDQRFKGWKTVSQARFTMMVSSEHYGPQVLVNRRGQGWERCEIVITVSPYGPAQSEVRVVVRTKATNKGFSKNKPPLSDHFKQVGGPDSTPLDMKDERDFATAVAGEIKTYFAEESGE